MNEKQRWRGAAALVVDAVVHGSRAVERIQNETAALPFNILERVGPISGLSRVLHAVHHASLGAVHAVVRAAATAAGGAVAIAFDLTEDPREPSTADRTL